MKTIPMTAAGLLLCLTSLTLAEGDHDHDHAGEASAATTQPASKVPGLETRNQKASYRIGRRDAKNYKSMGMDPDALIRGIRDMMEGKPSPVPDAELEAAAAELTSQSLLSIMEGKQKEEEKAKAAAPQTPPPGPPPGGPGGAGGPGGPGAPGAPKADEGKQFLEKNRAEKGVITTASGLQFIQLKEGNGAPPRASDSVTVQYKGTLLNGTEFDSSYSRSEPATFQVTGVIKGWTEALQMMKPGGKMKLFIPSELAYGPAGSPPKIPANATLIFEVELIRIAPGH